jgi:hypothetical protein
MLQNAISFHARPAELLFPRNRANFSQCKGRTLRAKFNTYQAIDSLLTSLGLNLPSQWRERLRLSLFGFNYSATTHHLYLDDVLTDLQNVRRRIRLHLLAFEFQLQTASLPRSITYNPVTPCQSQIFKLCLDGNIETVKMWFKNSWASPFVVNQHGENLIHVSNGPRFLTN